MNNYPRKPAGQGIVTRFASAAVLGLSLAACGGTGQQASGLRGAAQTVGWATTAEPEAKDFVRATRQPTDNLAYIPIGRAGLERPVPARSAEGVRTLEAALQDERERNRSTARRALPRGAYGRPLPSVAEPARPSGAPATFPVNPNRLQQMRDNADRVAR
jgi:hypothetical protein